LLAPYGLALTGGLSQLEGGSKLPHSKAAQSAAEK
jgi:hypothetical protein